MKIVKIEKQYDKAIEKVIRECLLEYGLNTPGTAWADPYLDKFSEYYSMTDNREYYVVLDDNGLVVGGCGYGELEGDICELQKMYISKEYRGRGYAKEILLKVEEEAEKKYNKIYLETFDTMKDAIKFYKKNSYEFCDGVGNTGHFKCGVKMIKNLNKK